MLTIEQADKILKQIVLAGKHAMILVDVLQHRHVVKAPEFGEALEEAGFEYHIFNGIRMDTPPVSYVITSLEASKPANELTPKKRIVFAQAWLDVREQVRHIAEEYGFPDWPLPLPSERDDDYVALSVVDIVAAWEEADRNYENEDYNEDYDEDEDDSNYPPHDPLHQDLRH